MRKILSDQEKMIRQLTNAQKREIIAMQEGLLQVCTTDPYRQRALRTLVTRGIAVHDHYSRFYTLVPEWQNVNVCPDKPMPPPAPVITESRPVIPDPPKKQFIRPPAVYSNRSQEDLIDHILKTYK